MVSLTKAMRKADKVIVDGYEADGFHLLVSAKGESWELFCGDDSICILPEQEIDLQNGVATALDAEDQVYDLIFWREIPLSEEEIG